MNNQGSQQQEVSARWSNRILIVSLIGIACLTLFPFQFSSLGRVALHGSPFLLGTTGKNAPASDFFLNVLLFIPFGAGLAAQRRKRNGSQWSTFLLALVAGAVTSYTVELLQFYIPLRNSGWDDVFPNTAGSVAGYLLFELCGDAVLRGLSTVEDTLQAWLSPHRTAALLLVYFAIWAGISIPLQRQTRLSNWDPQCVLFVGNDASGQHPWKGQVIRLDIWNRALPETLVHQMIAGATVPRDDESSLLASYVFFSNRPPFLDQKKHLPALSQISIRESSVPSALGKSISLMDSFELNGDSWLTTKSPAGNLSREIKGTNQFTIRIACMPGEIENAGGWIVSLSQSAENVNFHLRQENANLVLWFRNPLSESRSLLAWYIPDVFQAGQLADIVASYDGTDASVSVNGKTAPQSYRLSPGASLKHSFSYVETAELGGCVLIYEMLIFLPVGLLIGMAVRKWYRWASFGKWVLVLGLVLPPMLLDFLLVSVSGRRILPENIFISLLLTGAGVVLMNADSFRRNALE